MIQPSRSEQGIMVSYGKHTKVFCYFCSIMKILRAEKAYFLHNDIRYASKRLGMGEFMELIVEFATDGSDGELPAVVVRSWAPVTDSRWEEPCEMQLTDTGIRAIVGLWQPDDNPVHQILTLLYDGRAVAVINMNPAEEDRNGEINFAK